MIKQRNLAIESFGANSLDLVEKEELETQLLSVITKAIFRE